MEDYIVILQVKDRDFNLKASANLDLKTINEVSELHGISPLDETLKQLLHDVNMSIHNESSK